MHALNLRGSLLFAAVALLYISHHVHAQQNFNLVDVRFSGSTTLPTYKPLPSPTAPTSPPNLLPTTPPVDAVPPPGTGPITQPPLLSSVPAQAAAAAATTAAGVCATPLEFLQCRDNVGTFLAAMQVAIYTISSY
jgi:hypothetical protein